MEKARESVFMPKPIIDMKREQFSESTSIANLFTFVESRELSYIRLRIIAYNYIYLELDMIACTCMMTTYNYELMVCIFSSEHHCEKCEGTSSNFEAH